MFGFKGVRLKRRLLPQNYAKKRVLRRKGSESAQKVVGAYKIAEFTGFVVVCLLFNSRHIDLVRGKIKHIAQKYKKSHLIGGLKWEDEPKVLRFFFGRLQPIGDWQEKLAAKFREDFGDSL